MSLQDSKRNGTRRQSLDSSCSEWIYSPCLASGVCSCDPACVAARWVKATWNLNGPSWCGITAKLFEPWLAHFLHFDASCRRLHWLAGSPLKLRPLSSRSVRTRSTKTHLACCKRKQPSVRPTALSPETDCLYPFRICCIPFLFRN